MVVNRKHIDKVFSQKFSLYDQEKFINYLEDEQLNEETKLIIEEQWRQFQPDQRGNPDLGHIFYKLYYQINSHKDSNTRASHLFRYTLQIAAILVAGLLIAGSIYFSTHRQNQNEGQPIEFMSQTGFRNQFKLPDGTIGWLGYGTQLKYCIDKNNRRIIDLDGLAYFDVTHKNGQPFIVNTPAQLNIEVLGTKFNVSSYSKDNSCEIVLEQGKVRLNMNEKKVEEMAPSERVVYNINDNTIEKSKINIHDFVAWKEGKLILKDVSLEEACQKLARYYNVDFELQTNKKDNQKVRLVLENETLENALTLLTMIVPVKYQVEKRKLLQNNSYSKMKVIIKNK